MLGSLDRSRDLLFRTGSFGKYLNDPDATRIIKISMNAKVNRGIEE
jgi:hypothetical protein